jgi:hypothetical protein
MWQDRQGHVRVGLNHLLPTADYAAGLPFRIGSEAAHPEQVRMDWQRVADFRRAGRPSQGPGGQGQKHLTRVRLTDAGLAQSFDADFAEAWREVHLACRFGKAFDLFPGGAQLALLDLAMFGPGLTTDLSIAADTRDWKRAATLVDIPGEKFRQDELRRLFTEAAKPSNVLHVKMDRHWGVPEQG